MLDGRQGILPCATGTRASVFAVTPLCRHLLPGFVLWQAETLSKEAAMKVPIFGSCVLVGIYLLFKVRQTNSMLLLCLFDVVNLRRSVQGSAAPFFFTATQCDLGDDNGLT